MSITRCPHCLTDGFWDGDMEECYACGWRKNQQVRTPSIYLGVQLKCQLCQRFEWCNLQTTYDEGQDAVTIILIDGPRGWLVEPAEEHTNHVVRCPDHAWTDANKSAS